MHTVETIVEVRTDEIPETGKGVKTIETTIGAKGFVKARGTIDTSVALIETGPVQIMQYVSG